MKKLLMGALILFAVISVPVYAHEEGKYAIRDSDKNGAELIDRWAQLDGKTTRWNANDLFKLHPGSFEQAKTNGRLEDVKNFGEALSILIADANHIRDEENKMPFKACVFDYGDVKAVVHPLNHEGC